MNALTHLDISLPSSVGCVRSGSNWRGREAQREMSHEIKLREIQYIFDFGRKDYVERS